MSLQAGNTGPQVMQLQSALKALGLPLPKYGVDGVFGPETEAAVRAAQQRLGLPVTGVAGPELLARLGLSGAVLPVPSKRSLPPRLWILTTMGILAVAIAIKKYETH